MPSDITHVRLFDLVRYSRGYLHEADLITDDEYAWLCGAPLAKGAGSPSPRRLEDYDDLRAKLTEGEARFEEARVLATNYRDSWALIMRPDVEPSSWARLPWEPAPHE